MNVSLTCLADLDPDSVEPLFNSNTIELPLLLSFIKHEEATPFVDKIHKFLTTRAEQVVAWDSITIENWIQLLDLSKCLALFHQRRKFKNTPLLINFAHVGLNFYFKMRGTKNATQLDCNVLLQVKQKQKYFLLF